MTQVYDANSPIFVPSRMSKSGFVSVLQAVGSPFAPQAEEIADVILTWPEWGPSWAKPIPLEFMLAICKHEHTYGTNKNSVLARGDTKSWTNARSVRMPGIPYTMYNDPVRKSEYVKYENVVDSVRDGLWRLQEPGYAYAKAGADTTKKIIAIWAPADDANNPAGYTADVVRSMNEWLTRYPAKGETMKIATDRMIKLLRERGLEVHDMRGKLKGNPKYDYGTVHSVAYIILHYTGDAFSRNFFKTVTGTDYDTSGPIPATMSHDDEVDLVKWYDNYHAGRDGGTWPGIAYGVLVFPSGRVYVNFDIGKLSYHAFRANDVSYAISCPNSQNQNPTGPQERGINNVIDILVNHTPEIPADHKDVYGHKEATFLDSKNTTACPGKFSHVAPHWRTHNAPTVPLTVTGNPVEELVFPETGKKLVLGFRAHWLNMEQKLGRELMIWTFGYPLTDELPPEKTGYQYTVQIFERAVWSWHGDKTGLWAIQIEHTGRDWAEKHGIQL